MNAVARRVRAASAALVVLLAVGLWQWVALATDRDQDPVRFGDLVGTVLFFGWAHALAAAVAVAAGLRAATGPDAPARLLALAASGRAGGEWDEALRSELASVEGSPERRRFAVGGALTAVRLGLSRWPWVAASALGALVAALTFGTSRADLSGDRTGSLWGVLGLAGCVVLLVGLAAAWAARSMRRGLEWSVAAFAGTLVGILAVAIPEGAHWANVAGVFMLDGDGPATSAAQGALDSLWMTFQWGVWFWLPWVVLGPAAGTWLARRSAPGPAPVPA